MRKILFQISLLIFLTAFVIANAFISQTGYDALMNKVVSLNDPNAAREFLANLENTPYYEQQAQYFNARFDNIFAREIDIERLNNARAIQEYLTLLELNPQDPDVLIKLALISKQNNEHSQAEAYYQEARKIDPWIQIEYLE